MYGQMTAGSWIYIGTQGILQGTYETFAELARQHFGGTLRGTRGADRRPRRHGRRAAAGGDDERRRRASRSRSTRRGPRRRHEIGYVDRLTARPGRGARAGPAAAAADGARCRSRSSATPPRSSPSWARRGRAVRRRHRPDLAPTTRSSATCRPRSRSTTRPTLRAHASPTSTCARSMASMADHVRAMLAFQRPARSCSTTATTSGPRRRRPGVANAFDYPGFVPAFIRPQFCEGRGPFRWAALSGDPADIPRTDRAILELFPDDAGLRRWIEMAAGAGPVPGPAGADLLAGLRRAGEGRPRVQRAGPHGRGHARRSSSGATTSTRARSPHPTARPRRCATAPTRSPTGRCSTRSSTPPPARRGCRIHHGGGVGHRLQPARRHGRRRRRHRARGAEAGARAHDGPGRWASCATSTRATSARSRSPASAASASRCCDGAWLRARPTLTRGLAPARAAPRRVVLGRLRHRRDLPDRRQRDRQEREQPADRADPDRLVEADDVAERRRR